MSNPRMAIVFGGTGFVGHAVVQGLARRGYHVRVPTRDIRKAQDLKSFGLVGQVVPIAANVRSDAAVAALIDGCDVVINLIGSLQEKNKNGYQVAHVENAARIARIAKDAGATHVIHVSALGIDPRSKVPYVQTKWRGEEAMKTFFARAVVLRPSLIFGPRDQFFNRFAMLARYMPLLPLFGSGKARFQPVYVGDVAAAIMAALDRPEAAGGTFDLVGPQTYTLRQMIEKVKLITGRRCPLVPVPRGVAKLLVRIIGLFPNPLLTPDQLDLMERDSVSASGGILRKWGIEPKMLDEMLPTYLC